MIFDRKFVLAVLLAPLSVLLFVAVIVSFDIRTTPQLSATEWYWREFLIAAKFFLPFSYAGMLLIGIPVHILLKRQGSSTYTDYVLFGIVGGLLIGALSIGPRAPFLFLFFFFCGWLVSSVFWLFVRDTTIDDQNISAKVFSKSGLKLALLPLLPALLYGSYILAMECAVWWYGKDFEVTADSAAEKLAGGSGYCVFDEQTSLIWPTVRHLDKGEIIRRGFESRLFPQMNGKSGRKHHFRIVAGGNTYWWSFYLEAYVKSRDREWQLDRQLRESCDRYRQNRESLRSRWKRVGVNVSESNFCCPSIASATAQ